MSKNALTVENLTKIYSNSKTKKQNKALTDLTFEVEARRSIWLARS